LDHTAWTSPENWDLPRPAWQVNASCPGTDVGSDITSAFASGYLVFRDICNGKYALNKTWFNKCEWKRSTTKCVSHKLKFM